MAAPGDDVAALVTELTAAGETLTCAESLTAGLLAATIADVPGASLVLRGGVVSYAADLKVTLLGVPADLIAQCGTVDPRVAAAMAEGVRDRLGSTWGLATTGVAGPGPSEGKPAGTVHVAVAGPVGTRTADLRLTGGRGEVRTATVAALVALALEQTRREHQTPAAPTVLGGTVGTDAPR
ncbi:MAG: nicotinamide-nucleotide amidohydrolase family protein [Terracoccus sp.]